MAYNSLPDSSPNDPIFPSLHPEITSVPASIQYVLLLNTVDNVPTVKSYLCQLQSHEGTLDLIASFYLGIRERSAVAIGTTRPLISTFLGDPLIGSAVFIDPILFGTH
ncbi:MAG: hypothetical protein EZS28_030829 [Streblomastix strix]|uniref:Uncharacterized protein n=1 Tax=Streblomastix strix TaxID=222440 RepID=A0A5J4UV53_9EUKA|nr:MAG: hypothetical protein EZS28_030829 [Streblomastix strix]